MADENAKKKTKTEDELTGKAYDSRLMGRLAHYVRPYWVQTTVATISVILRSLCDAAGPYLVMVAIDRYLAPGRGHSAPNPLALWLAGHSPFYTWLPADPAAGITRLASMYMAALMMSYLFEFIQIYLMQWTGQKLMFDLRRELFRHMQRMHIGFFDNRPVGQLVTRLTSDVDAINDMFTSGVLSIVDDFFNLTVMAIVMLTINWKLALVTFSVLPLILVITRIFRDSVRSSFRRVRSAIARINGFTQEHISGMSVVQIFNREERAFSDFEAVNRQHMIAFKDTIFAYALYYPTVELLSAIAIALVIWRGGFGVLAGFVTLGVLNMFVQYSQRFWRPIQDLSDKYNILQAAMVACERIFRLLDTAPQIVSPESPVEGDRSNRIEFRHVWFTYQTLTEEQQAQIDAIRQKYPDAHLSSEANRELAAMSGVEWILKDVSFIVEPGHSVAIVGHTGAGKTTITALMMRFYEVTAGAVLVDGVDVHRHDLRSLREHFAVVLQDPFLFSGTIAENIRFGNQKIDARRLTEAARDVNVLDFIESLPGKFDEPVRERGNSLSTGQKQLINFARALAYDPQILILDEATSSVDTDTELRIRLALERMVEGRTSVLIAHRLSTVQRADAILVMHRGQLREMGSHQQLLSQHGLYFKLYQLQYKDQEIA